MGYKIFVSYKYKDRDVAALPGIEPFTWCRDYVDYIDTHIIGPSGISTKARITMRIFLTEVTIIFGNISRVKFTTVP